MFVASCEIYTPPICHFCGWCSLPKILMFILLNVNYTSVNAVDEEGTRHLCAIVWSVLLMLSLKFLVIFDDLFSSFFLKFLKASLSSVGWNLWFVPMPVTTITKKLHQTYHLHWKLQGPIDPTKHGESHLFFHLCQKPQTSSSNHHEMLLKCLQINQGQGRKSLKTLATSPNPIQQDPDLWASKLRGRSKHRKATFCRGATVGPSMMDARSVKLA